MNSFVLVALFAAFATANAGILAGSPLVSAYAGSPVVSAYSAPVVSAYSAPLVSAYSAPVVGAGLLGEQTVVAGPSGTIATGRTLAAPAVAAYGAYGAYGSPVISSYAAPGFVARTIW